MIFGVMDAQFADVPNGLWKKIEPLLPAEPPKPRGGRPRNPDRRVLAGVLYRLKTGCHWKALPREHFGSGSTCHERFQEWVDAGVFAKIFEQCLRYYDAQRGIAWSWASLDSASVKAPKGGTTPGEIRPIAEKAASNDTY
jgi:transposase